jgi:2-polyprenyl-3-methyl-5-hydroxy-6-metoxy-1,4-benzoquinol methylase
MAVSAADSESLAARVRLANERAESGVNRASPAAGDACAAPPSQDETTLQAQRAYWTSWNVSTREQRISEVSRDQREIVLKWLQATGRKDLEIIEVGCGAGWLCPSLKEFGKVTATDLCDEVLARAQARVPDVKFIAGDFMQLDFPQRAYDVVVSLEVLSHVADHDAFIAKLTRLLKPGGALILATQNRPALERFNRVPPPAAGQLRRWFDRRELKALLGAHLRVRRIVAISPHSNKGLTRLIAGGPARRLMRAIPGRLPQRLLAPLFGWTLMALAEKPV